MLRFRMDSPPLPGGGEEDFCVIVDDDDDHSFGEVYRKLLFAYEIIMRTTLMMAK